MRIYRDHQHRDLSDSSVVVIGNFDGVHRGHRALLEKARKLARGRHEVALVTFEPLPQAWFQPASAPPRITGPAAKVGLLGHYDVALTWMLRFNGQLASMSPERFVDDILIAGLSARHVVVGHDFRYGAGRSGDASTLRTASRSNGFEAHVIPPVMWKGERCSSTRIRECLAAGQLETAKGFLGRPFCMQGRVVRGAQLGRTLGYPTANLRPWGGKSPVQGVFAVRARIDHGVWLEGVASVGTRPAVHGKEELVEVHLFEFDEEIYGRRIEVKFCSRLRDERHFDALGALVEQMKRDEVQARKFLRSEAVAE